MPLPSPFTDEDEKTFISRCAGDDVMTSEYPDQKQRLAVCYSQWRRKGMAHRDRIKEDLKDSIS